jgi:hypothetical protein
VERGSLAELEHVRGILVDAGQMRRREENILAGMSRTNESLPAGLGIFLEQE